MKYTWFETGTNHYPAGPFDSAEEIIKIFGQHHPDATVTVYETADYQPPVYRLTYGDPDNPRYQRDIFILPYRH